MMNPDINDPAWIAQRELLWPGIEDRWAEEGTRKMMKVLRRIFFTGDFNLQDKDCAWCFEHESLMFEFDYYPVQTKAFWQHYFGEQARVRYPFVPGGKWGNYNPVKMTSYFVSFRRDKSKFGWDIATEVELHEFFFDKEYVPGERSLLGFTGKLSSHDWSAHVVCYWSEKIFYWILYCEDDYSITFRKDNKWLYLKEYFISCLRQLDEKYCLDSSWAHITSDKSTIKNLQKVLQQAYHFNEEAAFASICNTGVAEGEAKQDVLKRVNYLKDLRNDFESLEGCPAFHALLERAKKPDFKPDFSDKHYLRYVNSVRE